MFNPYRIAIGGLSQDGVLGYLSVTRLEYRFCAAGFGGRIKKLGYGGNDFRQRSGRGRIDWWSAVEHEPR